MTGGPVQTKILFDEIPILAYAAFKSEESTQFFPYLARILPTIGVPEADLVPVLADIAYKMGYSQRHLVFGQEGSVEPSMPLIPK